jgi:N-acetylglutamate synthase-like GNAT family acetyltransferase
METNTIDINNLEDLPICLASSLVDNILKEMDPYVLKGNLIPKNHYEIMNSKNFYVIKNKINQVLGFFEIRKYEDNTIWELGTVWGPGYLEPLLAKFEQLRTKNKITTAFAITSIEKNAQNFAKKTKGIITEFPFWIEAQRTNHDKYFIEWK